MFFAQFFFFLFLIILIIFFYFLIHWHHRNCWYIFIADFTQSVNWVIYFLLLLRFLFFNFFNLITFWINQDCSLSSPMTAGFIRFEFFIQCFFIILTWFIECFIFTKIIGLIVIVINYTCLPLFLSNNFLFYRLSTLL